MRAAVVLVAACTLGGQRPSYHYYVLSPTEVRASASHEPLVVDRVTLPGYLEREEIATRTVDHQLAYSSSDRWAEPLEPAFERTLREDLHAQAPGATPAYAVSVEVLRFERGGPDHVELAARWLVRSHGDIVASGETHLHVPTAGPDSNAAAAALSAAVGQLASEITTRLRADPGQ